MTSKSMRNRFIALIYANYSLAPIISEVRNRYMSIWLTERHGSSEKSQKAIYENPTLPIRATKHSITGNFPSQISSPSHSMTENRKIENKKTTVMEKVNAMGTTYICLYT